MEFDFVFCYFHGAGSHSNFAFYNLSRTVACTPKLPPPSPPCVHVTCCTHMDDTTSAQLPLGRRGQRVCAPLVAPQQLRSFILPPRGGTWGDLDLQSCRRAWTRELDAGSSFTIFCSLPATAAAGPGTAVVIKRSKWHQRNQWNQ